MIALVSSRVASRYVAAAAALAISCAAPGRPAHAANVYHVPIAPASAYRFQEGRALKFALGGYAQVIPVGAAGVSTSAQAINQHGDIVGNSGSEAFLYRNNRVTILPRPPGETAGNAVAYAINASDEVVGDIVTTTSRTAFLYVDGKSYDLDSLLPANSGWTIGHAAGINDTGEIVGSGFDVNTTAFDGGSFSMKPSKWVASRAKPDASSAGPSAP